ncbi:MAG: hypothetical protein EAY66_08985 [Sphingobacteriales bacterium]|nr:MAG: hypothetical protein EAY66_08985 [Sphingobacteriales bacterium]
MLNKTFGSPPRQPKVHIKALKKLTINKKKMSFIKNNYSTPLSQAKANVVGFAIAYAQFLERVSINQCSPSLISNHRLRSISNHRLRSVADGKVSFAYKDYADGSKQKLMCLSGEEFLRRFCLHILPHGFMKIRHYGILASRAKPKLRQLQLQCGVLVQNLETENWKVITKSKLGFDVDACPCCKTGKMIRICSFNAHAPPLAFLAELLKTTKCLT